MNLIKSNNIKCIGEIFLLQERKIWRFIVIIQAVYLVPLLGWYTSRQDTRSIWFEYLANHHMSHVYLIMIDRQNN